MYGRTLEGNCIIDTNVIVQILTCTQKQISKQNMLMIIKKLLFSLCSTFLIIVLKCKTLFYNKLSANNSYLYFLWLEERLVRHHQQARQHHLIWFNIFWLHKEFNVEFNTNREKHTIKAYKKLWLLKKYY
jgi:hypothetical protein